MSALITSPRTQIHNHVIWQQWWQWVVTKTKNMTAIDISIHRGRSQAMNNGRMGKKLLIRLQCKPIPFRRDNSILFQASSRLHLTSPGNSLKSPNLKNHWCKLQTYIGDHHPNPTSYFPVLLLNGGIGNQSVGRTQCMDSIEISYASNN